MKKNNPIKKTQIGAYYYLWYGRPTLPVIGGGIWKWGYTNVPLLGEYDSRSKKVISQHLKWIKEAGIDFLVVNWGDIESWDDISLRDYFIKELGRFRIKFCLHYDATLALNRFRVFHSFNLKDKYSASMTKGEKMLKDFDYLAQKYFKNPHYYKIQGQPMVVLYGASGLRNIDDYFEQLKANMEKRSIQLYLVADAVCWGGIKVSKSIFSFLWQTSPQEALKVIGRAIKRLSPKKYEDDFSLSKFFKAITGYNLYAPNRLEGFLNNVEKLYQKYSDFAKDRELAFFPNLMPGYDDTKLMDANSPVLSRAGGDFYKRFGEIAKEYLDPEFPVVLITSFNEWHEGTEIEPSKEYGKKYLELTKLLKESKVENGKNMDSS